MDEIYFLDNKDSVWKHEIHNHGREILFDFSDEEEIKDFSNYDY